MPCCDLVRSCRGRSGRSHVGSRTVTIPDKLVLWDVDHTLVDCREAGAEAYPRAFEAVLGRPLQPRPPLSGRTDHDIILETLERHGVDHHERHLPRLFDALETVLTARATQIREQGRALPGAQAALRVLDETDGIVQSVLTGNIRPNAITKLSALGLDRYIDFAIGAYGDDARIRADLVDIARFRAEKNRGTPFDSDSTVLIGDTPRDIAAARAGGVRVIAVATGRYDTSELRRERPDALFSDLRDTDQIVDIIARGLTG